MRARHIINASCIVLFAAAAGFTGAVQLQTETPAEKEFKNIQVFKGKPAREVRPAMEAFTSALGVGCDFCHSQVNGVTKWESDDKEEKKTAREMVLMMNKINAENFDGRMEVTCATCHQGRNHPIGFAPIGQPPAPPRAPGNGDNASLPTGESLVDKYVTAIGGSAVGSLKSISMKGATKTSFGDLPSEVYAEQPNKYAKLMTFPNGVYTQTYDGAHAYSHFGTETASVEGPELARYVGSSPLSVLDLKSGFTGYRRVRKDTLDGKEVFVVDAQSKTEGLRTRLYFDATTGLLVRRWTGMQTLAGMVVTTEDYLDYRDLSGVKVPYKVVQTNSSGVWAFEASEVKANEDIPDAKFAKPGN